MKNSQIISVSIEKEQAAFLDEHEISPSLIIQEKIEEQRKIFDAYHKEKEKQLLKIEAMEKYLQDFYEFLDLCELTKKFTAWRQGKNVLAKT